MLLWSFSVHYPNAFPIPKATEAANAPIIIVSIIEIYHFIPPTQLFAKPKTPKKKIAVQIVAMMILFSRTYIFKLLATIEGIIGVNPKIAKLKKVTRLFVNGFSSPAMSSNSSIIIIFKNPSGFFEIISTI